jgi:hypothetical protein
MVNDAKCTREIKSRIAMTKAAFDEKKTFRREVALKYKEKTCKELNLEHNIVWC